MNQKNKLSKYAWMTTVLVTVALAVTPFITRNVPWRFYTIVGVTVIVFPDFVAF